MTVYLAAIAILGAVLCVGLGVFTLFRNPRNLANIGFTAGMLSLALTEAGCSVIMLSSSIATVEAGVQLLLTGLSAIPGAWLLFSLVFARADQKEVLYRWALAIFLCAAASLFFILKSGSLFLVYTEVSLFSDASAYIVLSPLGRYLSIYIILGSVVNLVHLENTLRSSSGPKRWQIKYLIFGVGSVLAYLIYLASNSLLSSSLALQTVPLTASVILISTSMMALFIVKHRLLDVDIFISRYVIYNSITVLVAGLYLIAVGVVSKAISYFNIPYGYFLTTLFIFTSVLMFVVFLFTTSLRRKIQLFINRHFYKHKYEFRDKWMETTAKISSKSSVEDIAHTLKEMIAESTCAKPVILWLYDPASESFFTDQYEAPESLRRFPLKHPFVLCLSSRPAPFGTDGDPSAGSDSKDPADTETLRRVFVDTGTVLCAPLAAGPQTIGFALLGPDVSGEPYIEDDHEFLQAVTTQAAVQIKSIRTAQELVAAKEVEAFSKMSSFIMHDLKNLTNSLSLISQNARHNMDNPEFQQDAIKTIDGTVKRMKGLIERLSSIPREMVLNKESVQLADIINGALKKLVFPKTKPVAITVEKAADLERPLSVDYEAIEMVILNLISNAYDAIEWDGHISISASADSGFVHLNISDNGTGMSREYLDRDLFRPFKTTKKTGFGIGLYQCKSVIEAHGGAITVESESGKGTTFTVKLPLPKGQL